MAPFRLARARHRRRDRLVYSSLTDSDANAKVLLRLYQEQFDTGLIRDKDLRTKVDTALEYQRRIEMQIRQQDPGMIRDRLEDTANQITDWIGNIYALALRLDAYRGDELLEQEREITAQRDRTANRPSQTGNESGYAGPLDEVVIRQAASSAVSDGVGQPHAPGVARSWTTV